MYNQNFADKSRTTIRFCFTPKKKLFLDKLKTSLKNSFTQNITVQLKDNK